MFRKTIALVVFGALALFHPQRAEAACSVPYTLTNGTTADATQVMGNFTSLDSCAAPISSPSFTGPVGIGMAATNILDITQNQNGSSVMQLQNPNTGGYSLSTLILANGTHGTQLVMFGTGYTTTGSLRADGGFLTAGGAGGLTLNTGAQPIYFSISNAEIARFGTDGSLLVNTTATGGWAGNAKFEAETTANGNSVSAYNSVSGNAFLARVDSTSTNLAQFIYGAGTPTAVGSISTNGSSTSYNTTSDARLKTVLPKQINYRSIIEKLWVGDFKWKATQSHGFGILAQQAYSEFPEAVWPAPKVATGIWQADYSKLAPLALWGVKDLYRVTSNQNDRIAAIERQMKSLRGEVVALRRANEIQATQIRDFQSETSALQRKIRIQTAAR